MIIFQRLAIAGANEVSGLKKFPLHGPFPKSFKATDNNGIEIKYDAAFVLNKRTAKNSGFYFCCEKTRAACDFFGHKWSPVPGAGVMVTDPATNKTIRIAISRHSCYMPFEILLRKPEWLAYGWESAPVDRNFGAALYGADEYQLPSPVWRCKIQWETAIKVGARVCVGEIVTTV